MAGFDGGGGVGRGYYSVRAKKRSRKEAVGGGSGEFVLLLLLFSLTANSFREARTLN